MLVRQEHQDGKRQCDVYLSRKGVDYGMKYILPVYKYCRHKRISRYMMELRAGNSANIFQIKIGREKIEKPGNIDALLMA